MNMPKHLQDKPLTRELVASMNAIVEFQRGHKPADRRDRVHKNTATGGDCVTPRTPR